MDIMHANHMSICVAYCDQKQELARSKKYILKQ